MVRMARRVHQVRQPGADRIGEDDAHAGQACFEKPADAGDRPAGADAADERADPAVALGQDLRAGGHLVDARVGGVARTDR